jgi:hypothetical protein
MHGGKVSIAAMLDRLISTIYERRLAVSWMLTEKAEGADRSADRSADTALFGEGID